MKTLLGAACSLALLLTVAACGDDSGGGSGGDKKQNNGEGDATNPGGDPGTNPGTPGTPGTDPGTNPGTGPGTTQPVTCEKLWKDYVAANPVGLSTTHEATSTIVTGGVSNVSKSTSTFTVLQSKDELVETKSEYQMTSPITSEPSVNSDPYTKVEFLAGCKPGEGDRQLPENMKVEILEQRDESITVPAGTFSAHYVKSKVTTTGGGQDGVSNMQMWTLKDRPYVQAKTISTSSMSIGGTVMDTTTDTVLVKLVLP